MELTDVRLPAGLAEELRVWTDRGGSAHSFDFYFGTENIRMRVGLQMSDTDSYHKPTCRATNMPEKVLAAS